MSIRIGVIGTGYLGATHAACLAELGFDVVAVDSDAAKVRALSAGTLPFFEPGLPELLQRHTASGRLRFTTSLQEVADHAEVQFLCVGTPQRADSMAADTSALFTVVEELVPLLTRPTLLVGKSTVPVGTAAGLAKVARTLAAPGLDVEVAWNPEFLREGQAVTDTLFPDRLVFGVTSAEAEKSLRQVYDVAISRHTPFVVTDLATAELVKVAANAFLATKVSFANAMAELCEVAGGDVVTLADCLGHDARIGRQFLDAGLGFGGGCLPKDIRALMSRAGELGANETFTLLREVDAINLRRRRRVVQLAAVECHGNLTGASVAVLGAAFKPQTDDVRDSPALDVAAQLQLRGAHVRVYDPRANDNAAKVYPSLSYVGDAVSAVRDADLVLHLTEWPEFMSLDPVRLLPLAATPRIIDARNTLDADRWMQAGWSFRGLGRRL